MTENQSPMPKVERERQILKFIDDREVMLSPRALYDNLKEFEGITYSDTTVKRLVLDMHKRGLVERINVSNGYYKITEKGRKHIAGELDEE